MRCIGELASAVKPRFEFFRDLGPASALRLAEICVRAKGDQQLLGPAHACRLVFIDRNGPDIVRTRELLQDAIE